MLRVVAHKSAAAARQYYSEGLRREDYYSEGQEVAGKWHGKAARLLGLAGGVTPEAFASLVENRHPASGERLTARTKSGRVVGYDLNFHAPKSLSVLHALTGDDEILKAFRSAVTETMSDIEEQIATRVRKRGAQQNRITGNFAWAEFVHFTARPVDGIPDPHLHVHCFAFNATYDADESCWKAGNFRDIKEQAPYSEAVFHARLTEKLVRLGYGIERTPRGWEVQGISRSIIEKFSRRRAQIERLAQEKGITDPKAKDMLGAASRAGKRHGLAYPDLLAAWGIRLGAEEKVAISRVAGERRRKTAGATITAANALDEACEKLFSRSSVVETKRLIGEALRFGVGQVAPEHVWGEFERREMVVRQIQGRMLCTSLDVLGEEVALINFVRTGRRMHPPLGGQRPELAGRALSPEQEAAVRHILTSRDQVVAVSGGAGTGKTTLMTEAVAQIEGGGLKVFAFAPSAAASRETLRAAGFANAETVAHLLANPELQRKTQGQVIWIDEAGLLGVRDMWNVMQIAGNKTRVILTGDTAQHAPVARGDAFRLMQSHAGLRAVQVTRIRRQELEDYRRAVAALSRGDLRTAFRRLDSLGAIIEVENDAERYKELGREFVALSGHGSTPLVVSPTHAEGATVTSAIRAAKMEAGQLDRERPFVRYNNLRWEEADRRRAENYRDGLVVQFHQNVHNFGRGEIVRVSGRDENGVVRATNEAGHQVELPLKAASRFQVFEEREIKIARGERIRITRNGKSADGRRLNNGNVFTVEQFGRNGEIILQTGGILHPKHGHLEYGYCQTSHSAQSKSMRDVLVAQSADSFLASSREQFYVSVSRGKRSIRIYTDNRAELQGAVGISSTRRAGVELAGLTNREITSMVSADLNGHQWRELIRSRRAEGVAKEHVRRVLQARKEKTKVGKTTAEIARKPEKKPGRPGTAVLKAGGKTGRGLDDVRSAGPEKKERSRAAAVLSSARQHFAKVSERVKGAFGPRDKKSLPQSDTSRILKHRAKQQRHDAGVAVKRQVKIAGRSPTTPPAVRRGRA